jgi:general secretion pathway protein K
MTTPSRDAGYALVAAIAFLALFSMLWLEIISGHSSALQAASALTARARLAAAIDAGLALAVQGLSTNDRARRWSTDGRVTKLTFNDITLNIHIEDERGKIPISFLEDRTARLMFELAGAEGEALKTTTDSYLDWIDEDDEPRLYGAESDYYLQNFVLPRNGRLQSIDELMLIRGMTGDIFNRIKPYLTLRYGQSTSQARERAALPFALAVMSGGGLNSPAVIQRQRELDGQRTAIDLAEAEAESLEGQPLKVVVVASDDHGGRYRRATTIELINRKDMPYIVRHME